ncbi:uncharacterized protein LOC135393297 [Ornithodoros turicata]|uniref:uncharacterized protein LOC135393297 n=1 Tax=Ornithodoros turicata TaxID=34597 RepID=UPI003139909B
MLVIAVCLIILLLTFGASAIIYAAKQSGGDGDEKTTTEEHEYFFVNDPTSPATAPPSIVPAPTGHQPGTQPAPASTTSPTASTMMATTTFRPDLMPMKPFICLVTYGLRSNIPYPEDGLCDFLFIQFYIDNDQIKAYFTIDTQVQKTFKEFEQLAKAGSRTRFGIDTPLSGAKGVGEYLKKGNIAEQSLKSLRDTNIAHYSALQVPFFNPKPWDQYVSMQETVLQKFREYLDKFNNVAQQPGSTTDTHGFLIMGSWLISEQGLPNRKALVDRFNGIVSLVKPDAICFTVAWQSGQMTGTQVSGGNLWKDDSYIGQPNFEDTLGFRAGVTIPPDVRQLLGVAAYVTQYYTYSGTFSSKEEYDPDRNGQGTESKDAAITNRSRICAAAAGDINKADSTLHQQYLFAKQLGYYTEVMVYDTPKDILWKMCMVATTHSFDGGYVAHGIEFDDYANKCNDNNYNSFTFTSYLKDYTTREYTTC